MPPAGMPRPDSATVDESGRLRLETALDRAAAGAAESRRARRCTASIAPSTPTPIRDLLALDIDAASLLPPDDSSAASTTTRTCSGCRRRCSNATCRRRRRSARSPSAIPSHRRRLTRPIGCAATCRRTRTSRGCRSARAAACSSRHTFPLDGEYVIKVKLLADEPRRRCAGSRASPDRDLAWTASASSTRDGRRRADYAHVGDQRRRTSSTALDARLTAARADQGRTARSWWRRSSSGHRPGRLDRLQPFLRTHARCRPITRACRTSRA